MVVQGLGGTSAAKENKASLIESALKQLENSVSCIEVLIKEIAGEPTPPTAQEGNKVPIRPLADILQQLPAYLSGLAEMLNSARSKLREMLF